jgi:hypothetical protein
VLAIAHNGNLSNGIMFPVVESFTGKPVNLEYAKTRARWEPLYEVTQIKGDGEAHPFLSANDEFADYEPYSPYADRAFRPNVYFGDTHVHTGLSADAGGSGTR